MKKCDAIKLFGNLSKLAKAVGVSNACVSSWKDDLNDRITNSIIGAAVSHGLDISHLGINSAVDLKPNALRTHKIYKVNNDTQNRVITDIHQTLAERGERYGLFEDQAILSQSFKDVMRSTKCWDKLSKDKKEALEMVQHKIARILNGDPEYHDSWHDCIGYLTIVADTLER